MKMFLTKIVCPKLHWHYTTTHNLIASGQDVNPITQHIEVYQYEYIVDKWSETVVTVEKPHVSYVLK